MHMQMGRLATESWHSLSVMLPLTNALLGYANKMHHPDVQTAPLMLAELSQIAKQRLVHQQFCHIVLHGSLVILQFAPMTVTNCNCTLCTMPLQ